VNDEIEHQLAVLVEERRATVHHFKPKSTQ
jgi:hypothetical protein